MKYLLDTNTCIYFLNGDESLKKKFGEIEAELKKLSINIIKSAFEIRDIPELHDKLIAGTARYLNLPLITNDPVILKSSFIDCVK